MNRICAISGQTFEISTADQQFYSRIGVPAPTLSPIERARRRLAFRNEMNLYWRTCSATGKKLLSLYPEELDIKVYNTESYFSDCWNAKDFGRDFDFSRPFFAQLFELRRAVPHLPTYSTMNENTDYCAYAGWNKDCYLIFHADYNRDCYYLSHCFHNQDCSDCYYVNGSELCYGCVTSEGCYACQYVQHCTSCNDSMFLKSCIGCSYCFGCVNLRNKSYCFFNEQLKEHEYKSKIAEFSFSSRSVVENLDKHFREFVKRYPHKAVQGQQIEASTGDYLRSCQNVKESYHVQHSRDCAFLTDCQNCSDCYDVDSWGGTRGGELLYECETVGEGAQNIIGSVFVFDGVSDIAYSHCCFSSQQLFGCVGMTHARYCILNKQFDAGTYEVMRARIVEYMKNTGEWGEFFPVSCSMFPYNLTVAHEYFPLSQDEALRRGWKWKEEEVSFRGEGSPLTPPDALHDFGDLDIEHIYTCSLSKRPFKITSQELALYRRLNVPVPDKCFQMRHSARVSQLNKRRLYTRKCDQTGIELRSTFPPDCGFAVYSEDAYIRITE